MESRSVNLRYPAEWEPRIGTLVAWPNNPNTWGNSLKDVRRSSAQLIATLSVSEKVFIAVDTRLKNKSEDACEHTLILDLLQKEGAIKDHLVLLDLPIDDCWVRDTGPQYVFFRNAEASKNANPWKKRINAWGFNSWGEKYPPWDQDALLASRFSKWIQVESLKKPDMILEGGAIDGNGEGRLLTTSSCLLSKNRNPHLSETEIKDRLKHFLGVHDILMLEPPPFSGDDTDGHVDNLARFVNKNTVVCAFENDPHSENFLGLKRIHSQLTAWKDASNNSLKVVKLPLPTPKYHQGLRLPASYINFYFSGERLLVPTFDDPADENALNIFSQLCPKREVVPFPSLVFLRGQGGIHCLTQPIY